MSLLSQWSRLFDGGGHVPRLTPGNRDNAPAAPPVQTGSYEYIQAHQFPDMAVTDIGHVPSAFVDWRQFAVNGFGISGLTGGGATGVVPQMYQGPVEYYDSKTGLYFALPGG